MGGPVPHVVAIGEAMVELAPLGEATYRRSFAGDTFNTIWHMGQILGNRARCGFVSRLGRDALSQAFISELTADGLDISGITRDDARSMGLYLIELDGAERSFHYWRSASAARGLADDPGALADAVDSARLVMLSGITLAILAPERRAVLFDVLDHARAKGSRIVFDPNLRPRLWSSPEETKTTYAAMYARTDIVLPSHDDEAALWGDASAKATLERFTGIGIPEIVVKNGSASNVYRADGITGSVEPIRAGTIRDTSGAGDAFNAGYLSARLTGVAVQTAIEAGQALAIEVIAHPGARIPKERIQTGR
ncbi:sugar kinase [Paracoccus thiocyanatus]|uniref:2-dehydro-3-deoxygluconokinase n=1 Tax=Paracoccus thiocyanatus TaxID=34006 RepID=A0A3D8PHJ6_9RHOB|nr:sugar kinase [Paracoccus thiocyanatus]RDW14721.1 2-dehydro-3-deoxygluconokinase [Paracoccus thiocyanatus]